MSRLIDALPTDLDSPPAIGTKIAEARIRKGISQADFARAVRISRQAVSQIESGRALPRVDTALRMATALGTDVESLFVAEQKTDILISSTGWIDGTRVDMAKLDDQWLLRPSDDPDRIGAGVSPCDGILANTANGMVARTGASLSSLSANVFVAGCDPALEMLTQETTRAEDRGRCLWIACGNGIALKKLARNEVHAAGIHFTGAHDDANLTAIRRLGLDKTCTVIRFSRWEQGWMVARRARAAFHGIESLVGTRLKLVNREEGSGCRLELDRLIKKAGADARKIRGYDSVATSHAGCARSIAMGMGDAGLGCASMAAIFGLDFVPTALVAFDLVIRRDLLELPMIRRMCEILPSGKFLNALAAVPGYDVSGSGRHLL